MTDQSTIDTMLEAEDRRALRAAAIAMRAFVDDAELNRRLATAFDLPDQDLVMLVREGAEYVTPRIEAAFEVVRHRARELSDHHRRALDRLEGQAKAAGWSIDRACGDE